VSNAPTGALAPLRAGRALATPEGIRALWLGRIDFDHALALQEAIVLEHASIGDVLLLLEHDPVYTTGRGGRPENLPGGGQGGAVAVRRISRGGDVTYHGPGQLVGYPLVDLRARGGDVHRFLRLLEAGLIATLEVLGVAALRVPGKTGVWTGPDSRRRKIASIGIGVRRGISMHGFALNLTVDLASFAAIVPCNLAGVEMTSLERELQAGRGPALTPSGLAPPPSAPPPIEEVARIAAWRVGGLLAEAPAVAETGDRAQR